MRKGEITEKAELANLRKMTGFVKYYALESGLDPDSVPELELAVEEILVNIINYAYSGEKGDISIKCSMKNRTLTVTISDNGIPFNILSTPDPDTNSRPEERDVGGFGIFLARNFSDDIKYFRRNGRNNVKLVKKITRGPVN